MTFKATEKYRYGLRKKLYRNTIQGTQNLVRERRPHNLSICYLYWRDTSISGKETGFLGLKPGFNLHSGDILALKTWLTTKKVDIFKCTLMTMMAAFTNLTISFTSIYCNIFFRLSFLNKKQFLPSKSKYLSKNKISIKITLFIDLC